MRDPSVGCGAAAQRCPLCRFASPATWRLGVEWINVAAQTGLMIDKLARLAVGVPFQCRTTCRKSHSPTKAQTPLAAQTAYGGRSPDLAISRPYKKRG